MLAGGLCNRTCSGRVRRQAGARVCHLGAGAADRLVISFRGNVAQTFRSASCAILGQGPPDFALDGGARSPEHRMGFHFRISSRSALGRQTAGGSLCRGAGGESSWPGAGGARPGVRKATAPGKWAGAIGTIRAFLGSEDGSREADLGRALCAGQSVSSRALLRISSQAFSMCCCVVRRFPMASRRTNLS